MQAVQTPSLDIGLLQSAVSRPKATFGGKDLYPDVFHRAAALMEYIARNHPFIDGNKRTAMTSAGLFPEMNGYCLETSQKELERFALSVAVGKMQVEGTVAWFKNAIGQTVS